MSFSGLGVCPEELDNLDRILFGSALEDHLLKHDPQDPSRTEEAVGKVVELVERGPEKEER